MTDHMPDWIKEAAERAAEPLHPDLAAHLTTTPGGLSALKHPLVFDVPFIPQLAYRANDMYAHKTAALDRAWNEENWDSYVWLHERPYRADALLAIADDVSDDEYWELVRDVWIDTENLWQWGDRLERLLLADRPGRESMMDDDERHELEAMPPTVTVYRGCKDHNRRGWSWTWDREVAERLAKRLTFGGQQPLVLSAKVARDRIVAHFLSRGECEIVANPADVRVFRTRKLAAQ